MSVGMTPGAVWSVPQEVHPSSKTEYLQRGRGSWSIDRGRAKEINGDG